jgi:glycosyltransferase 2 family protein
LIKRFLDKIPRSVRFLLKLTITSLALWLVFREVNFREVWKNVLQANFFFLLLSLVGFQFSKILAAFRLKALMEAHEVTMAHRFNVKLLYIGMFYNLFLPGSIGGDGYKVFLLNRAYEVKTRKLIGTMLYDRISGLAFLLILGLVLLAASSLTLQFEHLPWICAGLVLLALPAFYGFTRLFFSMHIPQFWESSLWSFGVQLTQVLTAFLLLFSLGIRENFTDYLALFQVSSTVAVLPFTIAGVGARELVFLYGYKYLPILEGVSISFTLLFFVITATAAVIGGFITVDKDLDSKLTEKVKN